MTGEVLKIENNKKGFKMTIPIAILITIILSLLPYVMAYGKLTEKVNYLEGEDDEKGETIKYLEERLIVLEKIAAGTEVSLSAIKEDVGEIKADIKTIANAVR